MRAESGPEALDALGELAARADWVAVLLADHRMPEMTGVEFLEQAMDLFPPDELLYPVADGRLEVWRTSGDAPIEVIRIIGHRWSAPSHEAPEFLARNDVPYQWVPADEPEGQRLLTAGADAAVYAASEGLKTVVVERQATGGQAGQGSRIEDYLGFPDGVSSSALTDRARRQAVRFGAEMVTSREVVGLEVDGLRGACGSATAPAGKPAASSWLKPEATTDLRRFGAGRHQVPVAGRLGRRTGRVHAPTFPDRRAPARRAGPGEARSQQRIGDQQRLQALARCRPASPTS